MAQPAGPIDAAPTACPFVALEHDRDERSQVPDERHRCYAEQVPAQRTLAHQERFCLSPNFAGCPVFAEWAVRAAARPIAAAAAAGAVNADRAPELWVERFADTARPAREEHWPDSMASAPPAASAAVGTESPAEGTEQLAAFEAPATEPEEPVGPAEPIVPEAITDEPPLGASAMLAAQDAVDEDRGFDPAPLPTFLNARSPRQARASFRPDAQDNVAPVEDANVRRSSGRRDGDGDGVFTRLLTMAAVVIILALGVATVLIVPGLLSGNPGTTARPSLVAGASRLPTALASGGVIGSASSADIPSVAPASDTPVPVATPTPTPRTYKVQAGDSLKRIARQFGVSVADILAANPSIPDADHVQAGQRLVIPAPAP